MVTTTSPSAVASDAPPLRAAVAAASAAAHAAATAVARAPSPASSLPLLGVLRGLSGGLPHDPGTGPTCGSGGVAPGSDDTAHGLSGVSGLSGDAGLGGPLRALLLNELELPRELNELCWGLTGEVRGGLPRLSGVPPRLGDDLRRRDDRRLSRTSSTPLAPPASPAPPALCGGSRMSRRHAAHTAMQYA
eukprot:gene22557-24549_t